MNGFTHRRIWAYSGLALACLMIASCTTYRSPEEARIKAERATAKYKKEARYSKAERRARKRAEKEYKMAAKEASRLASLSSEERQKELEKVRKRAAKEAVSYAKTVTGRHQKEVKASAEAQLKAAKERLKKLQESQVLYIGNPKAKYKLSSRLRRKLTERKAREIELGAVDEVWVIEKSVAAALVKARARPRPDLVAEDPKTKKLIPLPLRHTSVKGEVSAYVAKVLVEQQFYNPFTVKIEATYIFPLPQNAAVTDFIMVIGKRKIRGLIREKEEAEKIYEEAKRQGYVASLLKQERPNIFTQKVANIEPHKQIDINITYFNTLKYAKGEFEFVFPMVVGPRFNPPGHKKGIGATARGTSASSVHDVAVEYLAPKERSGHDISLELEIDAGVAIDQVSSPSHAINLERNGENKARVTLKEHDQIPNKDFVLRYSVAGRRLKTAFMYDLDEKKGNTFTLVLLPPKLLKDVPQQPREMVFVVDCSGSMSGRPLARAKDAVRRCLKSLDRNDSFQIIRFSESAYSLGKKPIPATAGNIERGLAYVKSLNSGGGTMMIEGIKAALDMPHHNEQLRVVSFMTDGYIGNEDEILAAIKKKLGPARIFSFGVGSSVNRHLIEGMARVGRGAAAFVGLDEGSSKAVDGFYEQVKHTALAEIKIDWGGLKVKDVYPKRLPDLFVGRPIMISGRFAGKNPGEIKISGMAGGKRQSYTVKLDLAENGARHEGIRYVWARHKIAELSLAEIYNPCKELKDELIRFSTENRVLCQHTAFLAVDGSRRTKGQHGISVKVPVPMPEGVKYETTVTE